MTDKKTAKKKIAKKVIQEESKTWVKWVIGAIVILVIAGVIYYLI
ncbi:MAG: hypothetical protein ACOC3Z_00235 [Nanoarchaeota archaeon]